MRTTVAIDDDVLIAVRDRARRERRSVGDVLSALARQALTASSPPQASADEDGSFLGFQPLPRRGATVSNALIDELRDEDELG